MGFLVSSSMATAGLGHAGFFNAATLSSHTFQTMSLFAAGDSPKDGLPVDPDAAKGVLAEPAPPRAPLFGAQAASGSGVQGEIAAYFRQLMDAFPEVRTEQRERAGKKRPETVLSLEGTFSAERSAAIRRVTGNQTAGDGYLSRTGLFYEAIAIIFRVVEHRLLRGQVPIHARQIWDLADRIPAGEAFRVETKSVDRRKDAPNAMVIIDMTFYGEGDRVLATGRTILAFAETMSLEPKTSDPTTLGVLVGEPIAVTEGLIDDYAEASGDRNIVHTNSAVARGLGLKDRLLHGVCSDDMALGLAGSRDGWREGDGDVGKTETLFGAPVYPGDTLSTYRDGNTVTVVNQRSELVLTRTEKRTA